MYTKYYIVVRYQQTNESLGPIEVEHYTSKTAAEHVASLYAVKDPAVALDVYTEWPCPTSTKLASYTMQWVLKPQAFLA